jgi:ribosomal protein S8
MKYATRSHTSNTEPMMVNNTSDCIFNFLASLKNCSNSTKKAKAKTETAVMKTLFLMKIFRKEYINSITSTSPKNPLIKGLK